MHPARLGSADLGDLHAGIDNAVFSIEPLLEWANRDRLEIDLDEDGSAGASR
jgi:hypothetical protein